MSFCNLMLYKRIQWEKGKPAPDPVSAQRAGAKPRRVWGVQTPHVSKTTRGICTNPKRCLPLEKGYPCILGWPGEAIHSTQNIVKPLGGRGSAPNPGRWGNSQR